MNLVSGMVRKGVAIVAFYMPWNSRSSMIVRRRLRTNRKISKIALSSLIMSKMVEGGAPGEVANITEYLLSR